jgi:uncharacterized phage protein gp47/JayE
MQLPLQTFTTLVQNMAAAVQSAATQLLDVTVGSTLRAILEANASVGLWMQWLVVQVLQMTRAATSNGPDLDSWMNDFSLTRLPASPASGAVTLSRYTTSAAAVVFAGSLVRTTDGSQTFAVTADSTNAAWVVGQQCYIVAAGLASLDVPVVALVPGSGGNVFAGSITVLATAIPGIDTVINAVGFTNGVDSESDAAFRARFQSFISSRSRATPLAVGYAISCVQQGLAYTIQENVEATGTTQMGNFLVYVDDGSGYPSDSLLSGIQGAVDAVRPVGSTFAVFPPQVTIAYVELTLSVMPGIDKAPIVATLTTAITAYVNGLPLGASLPLTRIAQLAYSISPYVNNVTLISLNGQSADILVPLAGVVKAGTILVN